MGFKLKRINVGKLEENEERELCFELVPETRAAIHGVVKFPDDGPVHGAVVKLFKKPEGNSCGCNPCDLIPVTFAFTDECGQFLFGVESGVEYVIKVFFYVPETGKKCGKKNACIE